MRRATALLKYTKASKRSFLSTLSLRRATCHIYGNYANHSAISIHALLAESDGLKMLYLMTQKLISIHALLAESDSYTMYVVEDITDFYPRSPCGERLAEGDEIPLTKIFLSTLSLRRATPGSCSRHLPQRFLSTLSLRRATETNNNVKRRYLFLSTLSLRRATNGSGTSRP